ncbi:MAG: hypothetical protein P8Y95_07650 [Gammaproteobacteria bacterium]|jgi:hypothetical protein
MDANTRSLEESRKFALVQTYRTRAAIVVDQMTTIAASQHLPAVQAKVAEQGYDALDPEERIRWTSLQAAHMLRMDNLFFARQQGLLDDEFYRDSFVAFAKSFGPIWEREFRLMGRRSFIAEMERILAEETERP